MCDASSLAESLFQQGVQSGIRCSWNVPTLLSLFIGGYFPVLLNRWLFAQYCADGQHVGVQESTVRLQLVPFSSRQRPLPLINRRQLLSKPQRLLHIPFSFLWSEENQLNPELFHDSLQPSDVTGPLDQPGVEQPYGQALSECVTTNAGLQMPRLIFGTTTDDNRSVELVINAVRAGFRGIDCAGYKPAVQAGELYAPYQAWVYWSEKEYGRGLQEAFASGVARENLFIQTHVFFNLSDSDMDTGVPLPDRVERSIEESLANLGLDYLDSLLLPLPFLGWGALEEDGAVQAMECWRKMEEYVYAGKVRQLGALNVVSMDQLRLLYAKAEVKPSVVQPFFFQRDSYDETAFEHDLRMWCGLNGIVYQPVWPIHMRQRFIDMTVNLRNVGPKLYGVPTEAMFLRFLMGRGEVPITAPTYFKEMKEDVLAWNVPLLKEDANYFTHKERQFYFPEYQNPFWSKYTPPENQQQPRIGVEYR